MSSLKDLLSGMTDSFVVLMCNCTYLWWLIFHNFYVCPCCVQKFLFPSTIHQQNILLCALSSQSMIVSKIICALFNGIHMRKIRYEICIAYDLNCFSYLPVMYKIKCDKSRPQLLTKFACIINLVWIYVRIVGADFLKINSARAFVMHISE